ncbi:uncharacterized protein LOC129568817 isoform X4 [Sitodiplosis mosellana]|uniref:uncharacterized protein LOC129568817 isoform X4 n=1 Tax=Sitodiplosis mosellana TaxID=263140 RepID=UPI00244532A5|nr:uncharacterized protein LOC129568817 isoform X4 [Sitodiplosis mosellana]
MFLQSKIKYKPPVQSLNILWKKESNSDLFIDIFSEKAYKISLDQVEQQIKTEKERGTWNVNNNEGSSYNREIDSVDAINNKAVLRKLVKMSGIAVAHANRAPNVDESKNKQSTCDYRQNPRLFKLTLECFDEIFEYLSSRDMLAIGQTCKTMQQVVGEYVKANYIVAAKYETFSTKWKSSKFATASGNSIFMTLF